MGKVKGENCECAVKVFLLKICIYVVGGLEQGLTVFFWLS